MRKAVVLFLVAVVLWAVILVGGWLLVNWLLPVEPYGPIFHGGSYESLDPVRVFGDYVARLCGDERTLGIHAGAE